MHLNGDGSGTLKRAKLTNTPVPGKEVDLVSSKRPAKRTVCSTLEISRRNFSSNRRFFCRGGRGRLPATCGGLDEWRKQGRSRCGCATIEDPCALVRAGAVPEFWVPNSVSALVLPSLRPAIRRPCFPSRAP